MAEWAPWLSLGANLVLGIIGWFIRGLLADMKSELLAVREEQAAIYKKIDEQRETDRRVHREDVAELRKCTDDLRKETADSLRRVHARVDQSVKGSDCAARMDAFETTQSKFIQMLQDGLNNLRELLGDAVTAFKAKG